jgi:hypothetical protein
MFAHPFFMPRYIMCMRERHNARQCRLVSHKGGRGSRNDCHYKDIHPEA